MSEFEKLEMFKAQCKICMLAEAMKDCPICKFNIGLEIKSTEVKENDHGKNS